MILPHKSPADPRAPCRSTPSSWSSSWTRYSMLLLAPPPGGCFCCSSTSSGQKITQDGSGIGETLRELAAPHVDHQSGHALARGAPPDHDLVGNAVDGVAHVFALVVPAVQQQLIAIAALAASHGQPRHTRALPHTGRTFRAGSDRCTTECSSAAAARFVLLPLEAPPPRSHRWMRPLRCPEKSVWSSSSTARAVTA